MHVYVHVPFCARRCSYCDFAIAVRREVPSQAFVDAWLAEWERRGEWAGWGEPGPIDTLYFGGGTPSRLEPEALARIMARLAADVSFAAGAEVTLEANPEDVTALRARAWRRAGVSRISLGVQSFEAATLEWMHRVHGPERPVQAMRILREAGFDNVSIDLIYGVPASLHRDWGRDLDRAFGLEPDHVSLYALTVEPHTPLGRWVGRGAALPSPDERVADEYLLAHERLEREGFAHYEVSNAGRPGRWSRHNLACWRRQPYLGLGPSAHSAAGSLRWWNVRDWEAYRTRLSLGQGPIEGRETLDPEAVRLESLYLGLRTVEGVPRGLVPDARATEWVRHGWARWDGDRLVLAIEGWLRLDALVASAD